MPKQSTTAYPIVARPNAHRSALEPPSHLREPARRTSNPKIALPTDCPSLSHDARDDKIAAPTTTKTRNNRIPTGLVRRGNPVANDPAIARRPTTTTGRSISTTNAANRGSRRATNTVFGSPLPGGRRSAAALSPMPLSCESCIIAYPPPATIAPDFGSAFPAWRSRSDRQHVRTPLGYRGSSDNDMRLWAAWPSASMRGSLKVGWRLFRTPIERAHASGSARRFEEWQSPTDRSDEPGPGRTI